ncbi:hypothetical protein B0A48_09366 [Cryoendolithus antarcticus]|uniref:AB hydrolase-1 domain-containing protein n=1 Tax=Cryoendolithus antarcticus TaxID=1507870 RepID=A0A1V8SZE4_9PEZI|nr:hypothetical protein B0A48_09366 [Cryoendolithus antarcticus]
MASINAEGKPLETSAIFPSSSAIETSNAGSTQNPAWCDFKACIDVIHRSSSHQKFSLPGGRSLGFATFGAESGPTVFYLHGLGDSRLTGAWFHDACLAQSIRLVAVDRPGIGLSDQHGDRTVLNHAEDIRFLAQHLSAATYGVMGVSGGGIYAQACAYALPASELKSVAIVAGMGPFHLTMAYSNWTTYTVFSAFKLLPAIPRWAYSRELEQLKAQSLEDYTNMSKARMSAWYLRFVGPDAKDLALMRDDEFLACVYEAIRENHNIEDHMIERAVICASDPGFTLDAIRPTLPITLWYGKRDASLSPAVGQAIRDAIGGSARLITRDEAHLSLVIGCRREIVATMAQQILHD